MNFGCCFTRHVNLKHATLPLLTGAVLALTSTPAFAQHSRTSAQQSTAKKQATQNDSKRTMTATTIADAIEDEMLFDHAVPSHLIDVSVDNGIATLSGTVSSILAKDRATRIAETVKGVTSVVNTITVEPLITPTTTELRSDVIDALAFDPATNSFNISVDVDVKGVVTLAGNVQSWPERTIAEKVAKGVIGVTGVRNNLSVTHAVSRSDYEIQADVEQSLLWSTTVDDGLIDVTVDDGVVTLSGIVGSAAEKTRATTMAWVSGVTKVKNKSLEVRRWARDADLRADKYQPRADADIRDAVNRALDKDPRVAADQVTPHVSGGIVTLRGTVDNLKAKRAATSDARHTVGVTSVINRMKVRSDTKRPDATLETELAHALKRDPYVERFEINLDVHNGTANLNGTVDSYFEKAQAEDIAGRIAGISDVNNNLAVNDNDWIGFDPFVDDWYVYDFEWFTPTETTFATDDEIREEVEDELWWSPFVDSDQVRVTVENGEVRLTGNVDSWSEYRAAAENAFEGGATWVDNDLIVRPNM